MFLFMVIENELTILEPIWPEDRKEWNFKSLCHMMLTINSTWPYIVFGLEVIHYSIKRNSYLEF